MPAFHESIYTLNVVLWGVLFDYVKHIQISIYCNHNQFPLHGYGVCSKSDCRGCFFNTMVRIKVRNGESLEQALRRFNKKVIQARILREALERKEYQKPSEVKRKREKERNRKIYLDSLNQWF